MPRSSDGSPELRLINSRNGTCYPNPRRSNLDRHSIALSNFSRNSLHFEHLGVIHVLSAVIKGARTMTTSTIENREPAQATATETPQPAKKARVTAPKARVRPAKSANKTSPARKGANAAHKAAAATADRVRQVSKKAKVLQLVKRPGGATSKT